MGVDTLHVFLCHASPDKETVRGLYRRLARLDRVEPWLDEAKLIPGQDWELEIRKAVRASQVIVVCLSPNAINREGYVQKEIRQALDLSDEKPEGTVFLIPSRLMPCEVPERLRRWQWVDLFANDGLQALIRALALRAATLGIQLPGTDGRLIYQTDGNSAAFDSWTFHCSVGVSDERIRFVRSRDDTNISIDLLAFGSESVGANKSLPMLCGRMEFEYEAVAGHDDNLLFCMIPMQETGIGRSGLIEVGTEIQGDSRNATSEHRVRWFVPKEHYGDRLWHRAAIEFDFRRTPTAFYSIFAPRINEGCKRRGPGRLLVTAVRAYSFDRI